MPSRSTLARGAFAAAAAAALLRPAAALRPTWHADATIDMLGGPKPATGNLWTQCARVSIANPAEIDGRWSGDIEVRGGAVSSSSGAFHLVRKIDADASASPADSALYAIESVDGKERVLAGLEKVRELLEFCVDYRTSWSARPEVYVTPIGDDYVEVQPDAGDYAIQAPEVTMRKLVKRDVFTADWSSGSCRCLSNALPPSPPPPTPPSPPPPPPSGDQNNNSTCRSYMQSCTADSQCCDGGICHLDDDGTRKCSGPRCSTDQFNKCGLCLKNCGAANKEITCNAFNTTLNGPGCDNVNAGGGGGRCPGTSVCCFLVPTLPPLSNGECPLSAV